MDLKTFIGIVVILGAIGYYFDISPTDFLPTVPNSAPARERHASAVAAPTAAPQATTPVANNSDGSLASRWQPDPSSSAKKP